MTNLLDTNSQSIVGIGNSKGVIIPKTYRRIAGMESEGTDVKVALIRSKYGIFVGTFLPGEQPDLDEVEEELLEELENLDENEMEGVTDSLRDDEPSGEGVQ